MRKNYYFCLVSLNFTFWDLRLSIKGLNQQSCTFFGTRRISCHSFAESDYDFFCDQSRCPYSTNDKAIIPNWWDPSKHTSTFGQPVTQLIQQRSREGEFFSGILTKDQHINPHVHLSKTDRLINLWIILV